MKKTIAFLLGVSTIIGTSMPTLAAEQSSEEPMLISTNKSKTIINNNLIIAEKNINIGNLGVVIDNGNIMVPLSITAESLGFKVSEDADKKFITLDNNQIKTTIRVGLDLYYYTSSHAIGLTAPESFGSAPISIDNIVYVPIKIYNLLFNDSNAVGNFPCETRDGKSVYVNNGSYTTDSFKNSDVIGIPSPIQEFNTVQEAQEVLKFKIIVPKEIPSQFKIKFISTISKELFQICYTNDENDILFRMGQNIDKIDGDYNEYKFDETVNLYDKEVDLKGNSDLVNLATWKVDDMSYSISVTNGIEKDNIIKIINSTF
jgi:hypothetical protein